MRQAAFRIIASVILVMCSGPARAQESQTPPPANFLAQLMTADQMVATGVASLTERQRVALNMWLWDYTGRVIKLASGNASGSSAAGRYPGVGSGHWHRQKSDGGRILILEDGSIWSVSSVDHIHTMLWLPVTQVTVIDAEPPVGDFKYTLINTDDGETAMAKYLGKR